LFGNLNAGGCLRDIGIGGRSVLEVELKINRLYVYWVYLTQDRFRDMPL